METATGPDIQIERYESYRSDNRQGFKFGDTVEPRRSFVTA